MSRAHGPEGTFQECKQLLDPMAQLQARELKLAGEVTHILTGGGEEIYAALGEIFGLGLREIAPVAHDNPVFEPAGEWVKKLAVIDRGSSEIERTQAPGFVTLHMQLKAIPPAHAVLGLARPVSKGAVLSAPRDMAHGNGGRVLQDNGIRPLGKAITMEQQR